MRILYVEPFEAGSHASFTRALTTALDARWTKLTLPGRHWKWRMRGAAAWAALEHPDTLAEEYDLLFASSYVPLAELVGLAPSLSSVPRVLYFHENQLAYPSRPDRDEEELRRDHHFGFTQLVSCLAATRCVFNSAFNRDSLLEEGARWLARMPDAVPTGWLERIKQRSEIIPVPVPLAEAPKRDAAEPNPQGPLILWNHRWEHDKNPQDFFSALFELADQSVPFRLAVCGQSFRNHPAVFDDARGRLGERIEQFGAVEGREEYESWLARADIAVSTAHHEFFGISMIEAAHFGATPVVPNRLSYPEIFDESCRYENRSDLVSKLRELCLAYLRRDEIRWNGAAKLIDRFGVEAVVPRFSRLFESLLESAP